MGDGEFLPLTESKPMSRLQQNSAQLITSAGGPPKPNLVQKSIHWRLLGIWVKYNVFVPYLFIYLYLFFSETRVQVSPVDGFLRAIAH